MFGRNSEEFGRKNQEEGGIVMKKYRKYLEPEYGEVAPEVQIPPPQILDLKSPDKWRKRSNFESLASMTTAYQKCNCYEKIMQVKTEEVWCEFFDQKVRMKIYMPKADGIYPVMVFYHGGAFSMNNIEVYEYVCRYMSAYCELIIVSPEYDLAPEYKFPIGLFEAYEALVWTAENIERYGGNVQNISVCGDSSGGNFATVVSILSRDRKGPVIKNQILFYPLTTNVEEEITDSERYYKTGYFLEYNCMDNPMGVYFNSEEEKSNPLASPLLSEDLSDLPRACFISAECDPLLDQGLQYAAKLEDFHVDVEYHIMKGMIHGFLNQTYGKSFEAMNIAIKFINK